MFGARSLSINRLPLLASFSVPLSTTFEQTSKIRTLIPRLLSIRQLTLPSSNLVQSDLGRRQCLNAQSCRFNSSANTSHINAALLESLRQIVGPQNISTAAQVREQHGKDEGHFKSMSSDFVVWPTSTEQVSQICKLCYSRDIPMTPFGTGTGLEGGVNAIQGGVCIALTQMNNLVEVNSEDFDCTVEAGVTWRDLNQHLNGTGLFFPVDPGASASLGGMTSTSASGTNAMYYGTMKENVLNLEVVMPNGDIINSSGIKTRSRKSSAGLNLTQLFVGSEGILGIITKITLRLYPILDSVCVCVCHFDDDQSAVDTVIQLLQNSVPLSRIEYLDDVSFTAANKYSKVDLPTKPTLFMEIPGSQLDINQVIDLTKEIVFDNGGIDFKHSSKNEERSKLWKARHELYYACRNTRPGHDTLITDVCVPISNLTKIILKMRQYLNQYSLNGFSFGHVGDGNFHSVITYDQNNQKEMDSVFLVAEKIGIDAINLGGTCTGEHGVGRGKKHLLLQEFDPVSIEMMRKIKSIFDPKNLLNAGKVIPDRQ